MLSRISWAASSRTLPEPTVDTPLVSDHVHFKPLTAGVEACGWRPLCAVRVQPAFERAGYSHPLERLWRCRWRGFWRRGDEIVSRCADGYERKQYAWKASSVHAVSLACVFVLLFTAPLSAEKNPLKWASHQKFADTLSTGAVGAQVVGQTWTNWHSEHRTRALLEQGCATGVSIVAAELTKLMVPRLRPDGSDHKSFFSEHTAIAAANSGWRVGISIPLTVGTGYGRMAANKHFATDVLAGAAMGLLAQALCRGDVQVPEW